MDRHDLTSYPLKLPFIRSSKIARKERLYERTDSAEYHTRRFNEHGESVASQPQSIARDAPSSKRSFAPYRKTAIEIQLENFKTKAVQMGFCSGHSESARNPRTSSAAFRPTGVNHANSPAPRCPQSQPAPGRSTTHQESHFNWSQQAREWWSDKYESTHFTPPNHFSSQGAQTSRSGRPDASPAFGDFQFSQADGDALTKCSVGSQQAVHQFHFDRDTTSPDLSVWERDAPEFGSQHRRSYPTESASIPCGSLPHEYQPSPNLPRYCRWSVESREDGRHRFSRKDKDRCQWRRSGSRYHDDSNSLRGWLSQLGRAEYSRSQSRTENFGRFRNHSSPLLRTKNVKDDVEIPHRPNFSLESMYPSPDSLRKITRPHRNAYGLDFDDGNEGRNSRPSHMSKTRRSSDKLVLNLSPIAKSSPCPSPCACDCCNTGKSVAEHQCRCMKKISVATKGVQTKISLHQREHSLVDVSVQTDNDLSLGKRSETDDRSRQRHEETSNDAEERDDSESEQEEAVCRSIVASDSGEANLGNFLIGVEREP